MKELLGQDYGTVLIGIMTGIGLVTRLILLGYYGRLGKACRTFGSTENKTVRYIREDFERRVRNEMRPRNTAVYTECRLAERKVAGIRLGSLERLAEQSILFIALGGVLLFLVDLLEKDEVRSALLMLLVSGMAVLLLLLTDLVTGLREKQKRIRLIVKDCIVNGYLPEAGKTESETGRQQKRKREKRHSAEDNKKSVRTDYVKDKKRKKNGKAQEEKRRLTEELLRERRQLEARRVAEQRKSERIEVIPVQNESEMHVMQEEHETVTEVPVQPAEAEVAVSEAAATVLSYESLLSEVLEEYLA